MYYIHLHGNGGYLFVLLPGATEWSRWSIEYATDVLFEIKGSKAQKILTKDLPIELTETYDFGQIWPNIRDVYKLS
jgi:hypothetical protein